MGLPERVNLIRDPFRRDSFTLCVNRFLRDQPPVDILLATDRMRKLFTSRAALLARFGPEQGERILRRLDDLRAAANLHVMRNLPGRCHELTGDLSGALSIDIKHPYRLLFEPVGDDVRKGDGGLDWSKVTTIRITGVEDTHG